MRRADDRTRGGCSPVSPRETSGRQWHLPSSAQTTGGGEGKRWFRERNGRRVMMLENGRRWRPPRPRPGRRQRRGRARAVLRTILAPDKQLPAELSCGASEVILVLQRALRNALAREEDTKTKAQEQQAKAQEQQQAQREINSALKGELDATIAQLQQQKRESQVELEAKKDKLARARCEIVKLQGELQDMQSIAWSMKSERTSLEREYAEQRKIMQDAHATEIGQVKYERDDWKRRAEWLCEQQAFCPQNIMIFLLTLYTLYGFVT